MRCVAQAVAEVQRVQMFETYRAALGQVQASKRAKQRAAAAADFGVRAKGCVCALKGTRNVVSRGAAEPGCGPWCRCCYGSWS